jgi:hypothetical protein
MRFKSVISIATLFLLVSASFSLAADNGVTRKENSRNTDICTPFSDNRVHRQSNMWLNITNYGFFGNKGTTDAATLDDPCQPGVWAPQLEYPAGSDVQYLFQGALWIGALIVNDDGSETPRVSYGFEGWYGDEELYPGCGDEAAITEESFVEGARDCFGGDIYNPLAVSEQDFWAVYTDTLTDQQWVPNDDFDGRHVPLGLKMTQVSHSWTYNYAQDFIIIDYEIENIGDKYLKNLYVAIYNDGDVGETDEQNHHVDDICGFRIAAVDSVTGDSVEINTAYIMDNDGRPANTTTGNDFTCPDVAGMRVLRAPNPKLETTFNWWISNEDISVDFGPSWQLYCDSPEYDMQWTCDWGTPEGDERKYQVMSNHEFDYDQIRVCDPTWIGNNPQELGDDVTRDWAIPSAGNADDLCNGYDTRYLLSWGPLGVFDHVDQAGRLIYRLNPGEKFNMTIAYIGGQGVHDPARPQTALVPNYDLFNFKDMDFNAIWAQRVYDNEMYDTPVFDYGSDGVPGSNDPDNSEGDGVLDTGDGWWGEDVGADGLFAASVGDSVYYFGQFMGVYPGPDADGTQSNGINDDITNADLGFIDIDDDLRVTEDDILWNLNYIIADSAEIYAGPKYSNGAIGVKDWYIGHLSGNGFLDLGDGVPDFQGPPPPPCPRMDYSLTEDANGSEADNVVTLIWERNAQSASYRDPFSHLQDFEGYNIWVANTGLENESTLLAQFDEIDFAYYDGEGRLRSLPDSGPLEALPLVSPEGWTRQAVGNNSGFAGSSFAYSLTDGNAMLPEEAILEDSNQDQWVGNGYIFSHPLPGSMDWAMRDLLSYGIPCDASGNPMEYNSATGLWDLPMDVSDLIVLGDRFHDVNQNGEWDAGDDYAVEYRYTVPNARPYFPRYYAISSFDFGDPVTGTEPLETSKSCNSQVLAPAGNPAKKVTVIPNPYLAYRDYTQGYELKNSETGLSWENQNDGTTDFYPQYDRRIEFANLPQQCIIRIYTVAGDLVQILPHNTAGDDNLRWSSDYSEGWDLNNRNEQQVTSGLYLFSVEDRTDSKKGNIQTGKFVIIR